MVEVGGGALRLTRGGHWLEGGERMGGRPTAPLLFIALGKAKTKKLEETR